MIARSDIWTIARQPGVLTDLQLQVLELRELNGLTWNQISYALNRDPATVRGHYRAGKRRLLNHLEQLNKETA